MSSQRPTLSGRATSTVIPSETKEIQGPAPRSAIVVGLLWVGLVILSAFIGACGDPTAPAPVASVVVTTGQHTLKSIGETVELTVAVKDAQGSVLEGRQVTWSTSNGEIASVGDATTGDAAVTAKANGQVTITATADGVSGTATITVAQEIATLEVTPAGRQLFSIGETVQMQAAPKDARGHTILDKTISWQSSAPAIVKVDAQTGVATAMGNGTAIIAASTGNLGNFVEVTVAQAPAKLAFVAKPVTTQSGVTMPGISVQVQDLLGTVVASATSQVTVAIVDNPQSATLSGATQVNAESGVASFTTLSVSTAGQVYHLAATSPGLAPATSQAFEIMSVPFRVDSAKVASSDVKIGGTVTYSVWITNGKGQNATSVAVQAYIVQGVNNNAAGGFPATGCTPTFGVVAPGTCKTELNANAGIGTYVPGAATLKLEVREGTTLRGMVTVPVTMVL